MRKKQLILFTFLATFTPKFARPSASFGTGSLNSGSGIADTANPYAALFNPGLLSAGTEPRFEFGTSAQSATLSVSGVVLSDSEKFRTRAGERMVSSPPPTEVATTSWSAGLNIPFNLPKWAKRRAGFGIAASGPFDKLRTYTAGTPYDFTSLRYGTSDNQFKGALSVGIEAIPGIIDVGAGVSTYITAAGAADADLLATNPTARMNLDVGLNTALIAGGLGRFRLGGRRQRVALVYRQAIHPQLEQRFEGVVQVTAGVRTVRLPVVMRAPLFVEPESFDLEWQSEWGNVRTSIGVTFQRWSGANASFLSVESPTAERTNASTLLPDASLVDTVNPRVAFHAELGQWVASAGYQFRPSPVSDTSGAANLLDCDTHAVGLGLERNLADVLEAPIRLTASVEYHFMNDRTVTKTSADFIGAPSYKISGNAYTYGLSLKADF